MKVSRIRNVTIAGILGLVLLVLGLGQVVLAQKNPPGTATPSAILTESLEIMVTTTATLPFTATLQVQDTATSQPPDDPTPLPESSLSPQATETPSPEPIDPGLSTILTTTVTVTSTVTVTPTLTVEPSPTITPTLTHIQLPLILNQPTPTAAPKGTLLACRNTTLGIPDDDPNGVVDSIWINDTRAVQDLNLRIAINHNWIGDLYASLTHVETGASVQLFNRPGSTNCSWDNPRIILDDEMVLPVSDQCPSWVPSSDALSPYMRGGFKPDKPLAYFDSRSIYGEWRLQIADLSPNDTGSLVGWCLSADIGSPLPYTPPPPPKELPRSAYVSGVTTYPQNMPLDCESRVAVDWASFYGRSIGEYNFFYNLPHSDNPDVGFVGNVWGSWGQIPPKDYGVHAEPVAALLRNYGVSAYAHHNLSFDDLKAEIASGHPVFVWIVGSTVDYYKGVIDQSYPAFYLANDGRHSLVTPYEHVVIVVGYNEDTDMVTIKNEGMTYTRSFEKFLRSWSHMGNMAILSHP